MTSARPMASCCCWPPDRSPPRRCSMSFSTGNISKMRSGSCAPRGCVARPICRFLVDREARKDLAALRHVADAALRARDRAASCRDVLAASKMTASPVAAGTTAPSGFSSSVVLPTPLRPSSVVTLPGGEVPRTRHRAGCGCRRNTG